MAGIAAHLLEFPPEGKLNSAQYDKNIKAFLESLEKVDGAKILKADSQQDLLALLNPHVNSISYLYVLTLRYRAFTQSKNQTPNVARSLLLQALSFLQQFDPIQIRYVGSLYSVLVEMTLTLATHMQQLSQVVNPLIAAIFRIDPTSGTLTSTHLRVLQLCLRLQMYREALPILQSTIHSFPAPKAFYVDGDFRCSPHIDSSAYITDNSGLSEKLTICDVHEYFLLGGIIYIALQQWEAARLYLECVLVSPTAGPPSILQVEAYKKWTLVCCIMKGVLPDPPRSTNQNMLRIIKSVARAYDLVVEVFQTGHVPRLHAEVAAGHDIWVEDGNLGLIQLLLTRVTRFHILSMQDIYSAIPLSTVSIWLHINVNELHAFIEGMVNEKVLNADIDLDGAEPVLRFYSNQSKGPLAKKENEYHAELIAQTKRTNDMADYVKMSDRRLTLTKEYVDALRKRARNKEENGLGATGEPLDDASQLDEDIMMDE